MADRSVTELATILPDDASAAAGPVTQVSSSSSPEPIAAPLASVPGHEIICELGRGGMGVVYQARQTALNRIVAVKVVLSGGHASGDELARFLAEAEAVARMQHPNIVQIFERGQHEGLPYFTLEFVEGGNLARKLNGTPMPPTQAAQLVEKLASGIHYAHSQGIVHRDLKPVNVLLAKDGTPKITDFGLAKRVESASDLTRTGAIMGTPSYMAPEQASGKSKQIGPACDIYALGAILYECLTGRSPFKAATPLDTILQVIGDEPVPPSRLQTRTPRDLETICLKCLQKEPERRYATAETLAEDLRAFLQGRPITARPVGRAERAAKWVRRNPVLTAAIAAVTVALLAGTTVSTYFAIHASREAERAHYNEGIAQKHEADAVSARNDLAKANDSLMQTASELERSRNNLETTLARSWLRPLAPRGADEPMTEGEWQAIWEIASNRGGSVGYRFIEEALRDPSTTRQLRDRASIALPAVVGLDVNRRDKVDEIFRSRLQDAELSEQQKNDIAMAASAWGGVRSPTAAHAARRLLKAMPGTRDSYEFQALSQDLSAAIAHLEGDDLTALTESTLQTMRETEDTAILASLAAAIANVNVNVNVPGRHLILVRAAEIILKHMKDAPPAALPQYVGAIASLINQANAPQNSAVAAAAMLLQAMKDTDDANLLYSLTYALPQLDGHMGPELETLFKQAGDVLNANIRKSRDLAATQSLTQSLTAILPDMNRDHRVDVVAETVDLLLDGINAAKDTGAVPTFMTDLVTLGRVMDQEQCRQTAMQAAAAVARHLKASPEPAFAQNLTQSLSQLLSNIKSDDAKSIASEPADILLQAMKGTRDAQTLAALAQAVGNLTAPRQADQAVEILIDALNMAPESNFYVLRQALFAVATPAHRPAAALAARTILKRLPAPVDAVTASSLGQMMSSLGDNLEAKDAVEIIGELTKLIKEVKDPNALQWLIKGVAALAAALDPVEADRVGAPIAEFFVDLLRQAKDGSSSYTLSYGLADLLPRLESKHAATVAGQVSSVLLRIAKESREPGTASLEAQSLSQIVKFLDDAASAQAAQQLVEIIRDTKDLYSITTLAQALTSLMPRLEPRQGATLLLRAITDTQDRNAAQPSLSEGRGPSSNILSELAAGFLPLANRLDDEQAARAAFLILQVMKDNTATSEQTAQALSALLTRLDHSQAETLSATAASATVFSAGSPQLLGDLVMLLPLARPLECRLPTRDLVELLKMPTCTGATQRVILDHLGNRYHRTFRHLWQFVDYALEHKLEADLTTPPRRFEPDRVPGKR